jgi:hypothetical protein
LIHQITELYGKDFTALDEAMEKEQDIFFKTAMYFIGMDEEDFDKTILTLIIADLHESQSNTSLLRRLIIAYGVSYINRSQYSFWTEFRLYAILGEKYVTRFVDEFCNSNESNIAKFLEQSKVKPIQNQSLAKLESDFELIVRCAGNLDIQLVLKDLRTSDLAAILKGGNCGYEVYNKLLSNLSKFMANRSVASLEFMPMPNPAVIVQAKERFIAMLFRLENEGCIKLRSSDEQENNYLETMRNNRRKSR